MIKVAEKILMARMEGQISIKEKAEKDLLDGLNRQRPVVDWRRNKVDCKEEKKE